MSVCFSFMASQQFC